MGDRTNRGGGSAAARRQRRERPGQRLCHPRAYLRSRYCAVAKPVDDEPLSDDRRACEPVDPLKKRQSFNSAFQQTIERRKGTRRDRREGAGRRVYVRGDRCEEGLRDSRSAEGLSTRRPVHRRPAKVLAGEDVRALLGSCDELGFERGLLFVVELPNLGKDLPHARGGSHAFRIGRRAGLASAPVFVIPSSRGGKPRRSAFGSAIPVRDPRPNGGLLRRMRHGTSGSSDRCR